MSKDYYRILSVEPTASHKEIQHAADRLISNWEEKRGLSNNKRSEILSQIRNASAVLTNPLQRYEYDIKQGFKRDFNGQSWIKQTYYIPLKYSESIETIDTIKIPGAFDYEKLEKSIAAMETKDLTEITTPGINFQSKSNSVHTLRPKKLIDEIFINRGDSEADIKIISVKGRFEENSSNLKHDYFSGNDLKKTGKVLSTPFDSANREYIEGGVNNISEIDRIKESSSSLKQHFKIGDLKTSDKVPKLLLDTVNSEDIDIDKNIISETNQLKDSSSTLKQDFTTEDLKTSAKVLDLILDSLNLEDTDINRNIISETNLLKDSSSNLKKDFTTEDLKTPAKALDLLLDSLNSEYIDIDKNIISEINNHHKDSSSNLKEGFITEDLKTSAKVLDLILDSLNLEATDINKNITSESNQLKDSSSNLKQDFTTDDLKTPAKTLDLLLDSLNSEYINIDKNVISEIDNHLNLKQDFTADELKTSREDPEMILVSDNRGDSESSRNNISENGQSKESSSKEDSTEKFLKASITDAADDLISDVLRTSVKGTEMPIDSFVSQEIDSDLNIINKADQFKEIPSYLEQDEQQEKSVKDSVMPLDTGKGKEARTVAKGWKDVLSGSDVSSEPLECVSAVKRIAGTDVRTVYSFGPDTDFIEVYVNDKLRVKIIDNESHAVYCNEIKSYDLPSDMIVGALTVIAANNCIITTEVTRRGTRESIAVYKNNRLLCRTGSTIFEE